jgi:hypothetical protein
MNKNQKKGINSLTRHKSKLKSAKDFDTIWLSKLSDILLKYLGSESSLFTSSKNWYSYARNGNESDMKHCIEILESSIEFIEDNGIVKEKTFWRVLENMNNSALVAIFIFIINIIFWSGVIVGNYQNTKNEYELRIENIKLKDSLISFKKTLNIPDKKPKPETTTNK